MSKTMPAVAIPEDVLLYASERGLEPYLGALLAAVERHFPQSHPRLVVEEDPEVENLKHLVIFIRTDTMNVPQFLEANAAYKRDKFAILPADLLCEIRLGMGEPE